MKNLKISDENYEKMKQFLIDPFDDTPDTIIRRLININNKAKNQWVAFDNSLNDGP
jgi:hypothetical protein